MQIASGKTVQAVHQIADDNWPRETTARHGPVALSGSLKTVFWLVPPDVACGFLSSAPVLVLGFLFIPGNQLCGANGLLFLLRKLNLVQCLSGVEARQCANRLMRNEHQASQYCLSGGL